MSGGNALGNKNYELMSTMRPVVELIRHADPEKDRNELSAINKVLDVKTVKEDYPDKNGERIYWDTKAVKKYTREEYKEYLHSFLTLSLRYPVIIAKERLNLFNNTSGFFRSVQFNNVSWAVEILDPTSSTYKACASAVAMSKYSIFPTLRAKIIKVLGMQWKKGKPPVQPFHGLVWNIIVPMAVLIAAWFVLLKKRKTEFVILLSFLLVKIPIIFLTAPANWFMYYISFYFLGYIFLDYYVLYRLCRKRGEVLKNE